MIGFIFRLALTLILIGVVLTLFAQWYWRSGAPAAPPTVNRAEQRLEESRAEGDGPAERTGAAVDEALHKMGELTERAGRKLQDATDQNRDRAADAP